MADEIKSSGLSNIIERRVYVDAELRISDGEEGGITGYAAVFNKWSEDLGWFKEKIKQGAFSRTLNNKDDVRALINHDPNLIIGRTKNKTLELWEDKKGLGFNVQLPDTSYANDLRTSIERGDITQNSFGFKVVQDEWGKDGNSRTLLEVKLFDISPVTFPAYPQTSVKLREQFGLDLYEVDQALIRADRGAIIESDKPIFDKIIEIVNRTYKLNEPEPPEGHSEPIIEPVDNATLIRAILASRAIKKYF